MVAREDTPATAIAKGREGWRARWAEITGVLEEFHQEPTEVIDAGEYVVVCVRQVARTRGVLIDQPRCMFLGCAKGSSSSYASSTRSMKPSKPWGWRSRRCRRRTWTCCGDRDGTESGRTERDGPSLVLPPRRGVHCRFGRRLRAHITASRASRGSSQTPGRQSRTSSRATSFSTWVSGCWRGARSMWSARQSGIDTDIPVGAVVEFRDGKIVRSQALGLQGEGLKAVGLEE